MTHPTIASFEFHLVAYRRLWRASVLSSFLLPVLFLVSMGVGVGGYIDARTSGLGASYVDYIAPGVLATTALQVAVSESAWPVYDKFEWTRQFHAMVASPLRIIDILRGQMLYILTRVSVSCAGFLVVMALFGTLHSARFMAALPVAGLIGLATSAPSLAFAATVTNDGMFAVLFRFAVVPMSLFGGVFFPVDSLPLVPRLLAYVSPLWHGVELCRAATLGTPTTWGVPVHLAVLAAWGAAGYLLARRAFTKKLAD